MPLRRKGFASPSLEPPCRIRRVPPPQAKEQRTSSGNTGAESPQVSLPKIQILELKTLGQRKRTAGHAPRRVCTADIKWRPGRYQSRGSSARCNNSHRDRRAPRPAEAYTWGGVGGESRRHRNVHIKGGPSRSHGPASYSESDSNAGNFQADHSGEIVQAYNNAIAKKRRKVAPKAPAESRPALSQTATSARF